MRGFQNTLDHLEKGLAVQGFEQYSVCALGYRLPEHVWTAMSGKHKNGRVFVIRPKRREQSKAIHIRHAEIGEDDVILALAHFGNCILGTLTAVNLPSP